MLNKAFTYIVKQKPYPSMKISHQSLVGIRKWRVARVMREFERLWYFLQLGHVRNISTRLGEPKINDEPGKARSG